MMQYLIFFSLFCSEMDKKPKVLADLEEEQYTIYEVNFYTMLNIVEDCKNLQIQRGPSSPYPSNVTKAVNMWSLLKGIVPGTKWCGINDLGTFNFFFLLYFFLNFFLAFFFQPIVITI